MDRKKYYLEFIGYLIEKGYSEKDIADASGISQSTINRARNGITKLGSGNQRLLDVSFVSEKIEFDKAKGLQGQADPKDQIIKELREKGELKDKIVSMLEKMLIEVNENVNKLIDENKKLKEENERLNKKITS